MSTLTLTDERINAQGGLPLIGSLLEKFSGLRRAFGADPAKRSDRLSDADILISQLGLLAQGRAHYEDIELFRQPQQREQEHFAQSLGLRQVPSEAILRQRLKALAKNPAVATQLDADSLALIAHHHPAALSVQGRRYIPCDADVSPFDNSRSHREQLGRTYKGMDGFAPIFAYIGTQGWVLHHELRPGTQHCQKGTPEFLKQCIERIAQLDLKDEVLIRMDSGNDSADNIELLRQSGHRFIIKRNQRHEDPVKWLSHAIAQQQGEPERPREGKEVYIGSAEHLRPGGENSTQEPLPVIYRVVRRSIDKKGNALLIDQVSVETYWTNLGESAADIIELYHDHGTSEQYHSELKSDLNLERFPSQSYATNALFLRLGTLAYNLLRSLDELAREVREEQAESWPQRIKAVARRRIGSVVRDLILVACKRISHAGREIIKLAGAWPWSRVLIGIEERLRAMEVRAQPA
jgi:hypothetical protein